MINFDKQIWGIDFDGTLDKPIWQFTTWYLKEQGKTIYVITNNSDKQYIYHTTDRLQIPRENVIFTEHQPKSVPIKLHNIEVFIDNTQEVLDEINKNAPNTQTILA